MLCLLCSRCISDHGECLERSSTLVIRQHVVGVVFSKLDVGALRLEFTVLQLKLQSLQLVEILGHIK